MDNVKQLKAQLEQAREEIKQLEAEKIAAELCVYDLTEALLAE